MARRRPLHHRRHRPELFRLPAPPARHVHHRRRLHRLFPIRLEHHAAGRRHSQILLPRRRPTPRHRPLLPLLRTYRAALSPRHGNPQPQGLARRHPLLHPLVPRHDLPLHLLRPHQHPRRKHPAKHPRTDLHSPGLALRLLGTPSHRAAPRQRRLHPPPRRRRPHVPRRHFVRDSPAGKFTKSLELGSRPSRRTHISPTGPGS
jgi:hypothetical protein